VLLLPFRRFLVVLEQLECHHEDYLHRFIRLLGVLSSDQVHKELVQYLLKGHDRKEFGLDQHASGFVWPLIANFIFSKKSDCFM